MLNLPRFQGRRFVATTDLEQTIDINYITWVPGEENGKGTDEASGGRGMVQLEQTCVF